jgi:hypothetical protein
MNDHGELTTKVKEEKYPGEQQIEPIVTRITTLVQNVESLNSKRLKAIETVVSTGSAMTDMLNILIQEVNMILTKWKTSYTQIKQLSAEVSELTSLNSALNNNTKHQETIINNTHAEKPTPKPNRVFKETLTPQKP